MAKTLTYSDSAKGWQSFYSYIPEYILGMNNHLFTFKGGNLYRHNADGDRCNFYGTQYQATITGIINESPSTVKTFKTIVLETTAPWDCTLTSDLGTGFIDRGWFSLKEGDYFAHIRRNDDDGVLEMRSAQGIGSVSTIDSTVATAVVIGFTFNIDSMVSIGDLMYTSNEVLVGTITAVDGSDITVDTTNGTIPTTGTFVMYIKNNIAESYGNTGYYMEYHLELPTDAASNFVELYSVGSRLFKSHP